MAFISLLSKRDRFYVSTANLAVSADTDPSGRMAFLSRRFLAVRKQALGTERNGTARRCPLDEVRHLCV